MTAENKAKGLRAVFAGERDIRPGWLFALFVLLNYLSGPVLEYVLPKIHFPDWEMTWFGMVTNEWLNFAIVALLTWVMCRIDRTRFSSYGLRMSSGWARLFAQGVVWGIVPSIVIVIPIWLAGACSFHGLALPAGELIKYAALWASAASGRAGCSRFLWR